VFEGPDVAVEEHLLGLVQIRPRVGTPDAESGMMNIDTSTNTPAKWTLADPKSTSASYRRGGAKTDEHGGANLG
jgi:hypothetical protein